MPDDAIVRRNGSKPNKSGSCPIGLQPIPTALSRRIGFDSNAATKYTTTTLLTKNTRVYLPLVSRR